MTYVDVFERSGGFVASGDAEQWGNTESALNAYADTVSSLWHDANPWELDTYDVMRKLGRVQLLAKEAHENIFIADQWGRMSTELFSNQAEAIKFAIADHKPENASA